jgi:hypothetical protein
MGFGRNSSTRRKYLVFSVLLTCSSASLVEAAPHKAHPISPILKPFVSAPDAVELSKAEKSALRAGKPVFRASNDSKSGGGVAIQDINAPEDYVWKVILSYDRYAGWVKTIDKCAVYKRKGRLVYIDMLTSFFMIKSQIYLIHRIQRALGYISWTLDRSRSSDLHDVIGYWRITQISEHPPRTRLQHASSIVAGSVPDFVVDFLTKDAVLDGTAWVKEQAEKAWQADQD